MKNNQPIVFNVRYTTYNPPTKSRDRDLIERHADHRAYYDMTRGYNIYNYMTTEGKLKGKFTFLEYLRKNTGVFNQYGMISEVELKEMRKRASENKGNIWHGFISLNEKESPKIDSTEKCIRLIKSTFPSFLRDVGLNPQNVDLMCALHLDKPHHLHIHFVFWEKEPMYTQKKGEALKYRSKGTIGKQAIDNMFVRLAMGIDDHRAEIHNARDEAIQSLRGMTYIKRAIDSNKRIRREILSLASDLPKSGRLSYGSKDMEAYKGRVDKIVKMMLDYDRVARKADLRFYEALERKRKAVENICGKEFAMFGGIEQDAPTYHYKIDPAKIKVIEDIENDYKRRQGNLVLNLCKFIILSKYDRDPNRKYRANNKRLKRRLSVSENIIGQGIDRFFKRFGKDLEALYERDFSHRLQEIENEIEEEKEAETQNNKKEETIKI